MRSLRPVLVALAWCVFALSTSEAQDALTPAARVPFITVEGVASREALPDLAVISLGVTTERPTATDAAAQNNKAAAALLVEIKAIGVADVDIQTTQVSLEPVQDPHDDTKTKGFQAANTIAIRVRDLATVGDIVGRLVDKGANTVEGIDFTVSNPQPILDGLRADATHDALHQAEIFAHAAGVKLGRILEIVPQSNPYAPAMRSYKTQRAVRDAAPAPVQAGTQTLESRVRMTLELVP